MRIITIILFTLFFFSGFSQQAQPADTSSVDLKAFAAKIIGNETDGYQKAEKILRWLSNNFEWKATDYKTRTVKEIIARNGGNCFELAKVYMALIKNEGITYRGVCEINIHPESETRQASAAALVKQKGNAFSVFGFQHNDHRWVEIFNKKYNRWEPADPSTGVIGLTEWLKARVWFGERKTVDTSVTNDMIVPFAIFATGDHNLPEESRTMYYLSDSFNDLYKGRLAGLPEWPEWIAALKMLNTPVMNAFAGKENLHQYREQIRKLADVYSRLKKSYIKKYGDK